MIVYTIKMQSRKKIPKPIIVSNGRNLIPQTILRIEHLPPVENKHRTQIVSLGQNVWFESSLCQSPAVSFLFLDFNIIIRNFNITVGRVDNNSLGEAVEASLGEAVVVNLAVEVVVSSVELEVELEVEQLEVGAVAPLVEVAVEHLLLEVS